MTNLNNSLVLTLLVLSCSIMGQRGEALAQEVSDAARETLNPLSAIDPSSLKGFRDRPLFSPSRSRPEDIQETVQEPFEEPPESLNLQLLGIVVTPMGATARMVDLTDDTRYSLREGDTVLDWSVESVGSSNVTLGRDGEKKQFSVFKPPSRDVLLNTAAEEAEQPEAGRKVRVITMSP